MITLTMLLTKRDDLTDEEFRHYYEERHIPLVARLVRARPVGYARHHRMDDALARRLAEGRGDRVEENVSAITHITLATRADAEQLVETMLEQSVRDALTADEGRFLAEGGIRWLVTGGPDDFAP
ncbi:EthD domain-containing protein [Nocardia brevicatena]|uniref:EthD domain-containing protein n=1 Tax=Nocardia brevicatena TaxID=37327 RepID=UPI00030DBC2E|nr:EthD domain-containing protein [Nocardia brevicatena]